MRFPFTSYLATPLGIVLLLASGGCGTPVVKVAAFDPDVLTRSPLPAERMRPAPHAERIVAPDPAWLADVAGGKTLVFAALRRTGGPDEYAAVVACDPASDRLVLLPLAAGRTPLAFLADPAARTDLREQVARLRTSSAGGGRGGVKVVSLRAAIEHGCLGSPIPAPGRIYAVAANFPSHLRHDLAISISPVQRAALSASRARVFLKHPVTTARGEVNRDTGKVLGPFDALVYSAEIELPSPGEAGGAARTATRLDYEVEVGAVIGRRLRAEDVAQLSDEELMNAVAGYVLISDSKARNPQVVDKLADDEELSETNPYAVGDDGLDRALGSWDPTTCRWWSYAASRVDATAIGPFLAAAPSAGGFPPRPIVAARSYAASDVRAAAIPAGRDADVLYLRQCAAVNDNESYTDALIWDLPAIIRSILAPDDNALQFSEFPIELDPGDVICLGTPGGTVITSRPESALTVLRHLLFWWRPRDFHDAFFGPDAALYLRHGDEVFFWGAGLGYQHHVVRCAD